MHNPPNTNKFFFLFSFSKKSCSWLRNAARHSPPPFYFFVSLCRCCVRVCVCVYCWIWGGGVEKGERQKKPGAFVHYQPVAPRCQVCSLSLSPATKILIFFLKGSLFYSNLISFNVIISKIVIVWIVQHFQQHNCVSLGISSTFDWVYNFILIK